jgi:hypothetical protein
MAAATSLLLLPLCITCLRSLLADAAPHFLLLLLLLLLLFVVLCTT